MRAIQFETVVNGDVIPIPVQYRDKLQSGAKVRVVVDVEPRTKAGSLSPEDFSSLKIDPRGFKFDREEANERCSRLMSV